MRCLLLTASLLAAAGAVPAWQCAYYGEQYCKALLEASGYYEQLGTGSPEAALSDIFGAAAAASPSAEPAAEPSAAPEPSQEPVGAPLAAIVAAQEFAPTPAPTPAPEPSTEAEPSLAVPPSFPGGYYPHHLGLQYHPAALAYYASLSQQI
ncbi:hypothetical protein FJT64_001458 [Amphibalanus amphitrite]|uniref:Uncharacterized protein n=1 Tax=Amphibalanus amphitrite TaxID=1232801 RepID=A0A6A4V7H5_AMPAM|nr:hypothetical protein FJT64_001458 [Amphibalanus amphitrite]